MATKTPTLAGLEPRAFWEHFETLTTIARPSRHEEPVIEHVRAWADAARLRTAAGRGAQPRDRRPGNAPGRESAPMIVLQGHLDMVCERSPDSPNDPTEGRIELVVDGDWLTANGTTLGADDGVAIAAMMALVDDASLPHGPLQLLMTVAEEVGLEGANGLDGSLVHGTILVNLDSEEDGRLTVGCAGSTDTWIRIAPTARAGRGRDSRVDRDGERRARRALGHQHPARPLERDQGARPRAPRGVRDDAVPPRLAATAARAATRSRATRSPSVVVAAESEQDFRAAVDKAAADDRRRVSRRPTPERRSPSTPPTRLPTPGRKREPRCAARRDRRSSRRARSR